MTIGKISDNFFKNHVLNNLGSPDPRIVLGPQMGVDAGVIKTGDKFMVIAEDPIFPVPGLPDQDFGWFTVHIGASDVAVLGVKPEFLTYSLLVPPGTPDKSLADIVNSISGACLELDITIVGGHTGYYPSVTVPTIGGVTVWGFGDKIVNPADTRPGDRVLITKGAAVEAVGILATVFSEEMRKAGIEEDVIKNSARKLYDMSVIKDALLAVEVGGVHAMHDATEGGVLRGLYEVAETAGVGLAIDGDKIPVDDYTIKTCRYFGIEPLVSISEGTLIITCLPEKAGEVIKALETVNITTADIGEVVSFDRGRTIKIKGETREIIPPQEDPFWKVFFSRLGKE